VGNKVATFLLCGGQFASHHDTLQIRRTAAKPRQHLPQFSPSLHTQMPTCATTAAAVVAATSAAAELLQLCLPLPLCITNDFINFQITESQRPAEHFGCNFVGLYVALGNEFKPVFDFRLLFAFFGGRCEKISVARKCHGST